VEGEVIAPGIPYEAIIFHRQADKLRSATVNISIIPVGQIPMNDIGNVYSASREEGGGPQKLWINWRTSDTLQIFRNPETHAYKENKNFDCLTGIFIQTTPFKIEYGDIRDVQSPSTSQPPAKSQKKSAPVPSKVQKYKGT
jgi:hypothetical protein